MFDEFMRTPATVRCMSPCAQASLMYAPAGSPSVKRPGTSTWRRRGREALVEQHGDRRRLDDRSGLVRRAEAAGAEASTSSTPLTFVGVDRRIVGDRHDVPVADPHDHRGAPVGAGRLRLLRQSLLREPLQVGVDREREGAAVDGGLCHDGAARKPHAVRALLVGRGAVRRGEAAVLLELDAGLRAVGADEADEVAGDGAVRIGARRVRFAVDPRDLAAPSPC